MSNILKLKPAFKDYIWGGEILKNEYNITDMDRVAEAWVLSCHKDGQSTVIGGEYAGLTLSQALGKMGKAALGKNAERFEFFPQLIKLIDARDNLSVQVHPSDEYALKNEGQYGKTEIWYILSAEEGAGIYYGFKNKITDEEFERHIKNNTLTDALQFVPVKAGKGYFIPSGTIHAIGKGLLIAEIQQNSNVTYRVYDFGRLGADGKPRELHTEKAKAVTVLAPVDKSVQQCCSCDYFTVEGLSVNGMTEIQNTDSFTALLITQGAGSVNGEPFEKFDTFFIPANTKATLSGNFKALISTI